MAVAENKSVALRYFEMVNHRNFDDGHDFIAEDFVDHSAMPGQAAGYQGLREFFAMFVSAFPDLQATVEDVIAEGDKVAVRFSVRGTHEGELMGIPATGRQVQFEGIDIFRVADGKIVALWGKEDLLGLMQQIGAV